MNGLRECGVAYVADDGERGVCTLTEEHAGPHHDERLEDPCDTESS